MPEMSFDNTENVLEYVREIYVSADGNFRDRMYREILENALKFKRDELGTLDLKIMSRAMAEYRYAARVFKPYKQMRKVSIFGSARTPEDDPYFDMAVKFSRMLVENGFMVITGAASGIMRAGNVGAGRDNSFGANILLPFEQGANEIIADDPKLITFRYFFIRKLFFLMEAHAVALFPGGFGTHDEGYETLTLLQTGKAPPMPLVLMELPDEDYWECWDQFVRNQLLKRKLISPDDLSLYKIVQSAEDAIDWILHYYSTYHSMRQVRERRVIRLEKELTDKHIEKLNDEFGELFMEGRIEKSKPLSAEKDEPELMAKPRLVFPYGGVSPGTLNRMIHTINDMGKSIE